MLKDFPVEVRVPFRAGIRSNVGKVGDPVLLKQIRENFDTSIAVSQRVKLIHEKSLSLASYIVK